MARRNTQSVSLWHPWQDKPGQSHTLALLEDFDFRSTDDLLQTLSGGKYYALCEDIFSPREVEPSLLRNGRTEPYLSKSGNIAALRIKGRRGSGFIIPAIQWSEVNRPSRQSLTDIQSIFTIFDREALTPSSLSEKVLRSTLPDKLFISRPSVNLRSAILRNRSIARVTRHKRGVRSPIALEYDKIKAYLSIAAQGVPSPFSAPLRFLHSNCWQEAAISFMRVQMTCHTQKGRIQPLQIPSKEAARAPHDGEQVNMWLWSDKVHDCVEAGYTLDEVIEGYAWDSLSGFMSSWSDILFSACEKYKEESFYPILKRMTQGLPGRFLKAPEVYSLIHFSEYQDGDIPITRKWTGTDSPMTDWFMRVDKESYEARESAQLTPIGDYIVNECERQMYHAARSEEDAGNVVLRIYVDSLTLSDTAKHITVGSKPGQFKVKKYFKAKFIENRFKGYEEVTGLLIAKTPGMAENSKQRLAFINEEECETCPDTS